MEYGKRKIMFFAEGATLAHVARPLSLAEILSQDNFQISFSRPACFNWLTAKADFPVLDLHCQDRAIFAKKLRRGMPLYDLPTLEQYVTDDLELIDAEQPDLIVGDFRLSLAVSARLAKVPYITICDAYWSTESTHSLELPVMPWTPYVPLPIAQMMFDFATPFALGLHAAPMKQLRAQHGITSTKCDIRFCYTDADTRLYANFPALFPSINESNSARFLGPVAWSPEIHYPFDELPVDEKIIYVSMGSSGAAHALRPIVAALEKLPYMIVITTAGQPVPENLCSSKTKVFDFLPGHLACEKAMLVICNGGSPTTNQALTHGVPVLGIPHNMDQFLNMRAISEFGAGMAIRSDRITESAVKHSVNRILSDRRFTANAERLAVSVTPQSILTQFESAINALLA